MTKFTNKKYKIGLLIIATVIILVIIFWLLMNTQSEVAEEKFGIYYLDETGDNHLIISDDDIIFYNKSSHIIKFTDEGYENISSLFSFTMTSFNFTQPENRSEFVFKLHGKELYHAKYYSMIISYTPQYPVLIKDWAFIDNDEPYSLGENNSIKIVLSPFFEGNDPRNNTELFDYFVPWYNECVNFINNHPSKED